VSTRTTRARGAFAKQHGLPYIRGGLMELGRQPGPESPRPSLTRPLLSFVRAAKPFGTEFKQLMRASILRDRLAGCSLIGHDLPYLSHTVTLDAKVRDVFGLPVALITWSAGKHEQVAQQFWTPAAEADDESGRRGRGPGRYPPPTTAAACPPATTSWAA